jgi:hypothetical protein
MGATKKALARPEMEAREGTSNELPGIFGRTPKGALGAPGWVPKGSLDGPGKRKRGRAASREGRRM